MARALSTRLVPIGVGLLFAALCALPLVGCGDEPAPKAGGASGATYDADGRYIGPTRPTPEGTPPNLIVLLIDTLRADAVAEPGTRGGLMPFTTSLAAEGVFLRDATAPSSWTVPSVTSFLTGLLPSGHGSDAPMRAPRLVDAVTTYAEVLRESHGYETGAYTSGPWMDEKMSILQGFTFGTRGYALQGTHKILEGFATKRKKEKPFFLLLHTYEAHDPYGEANHPWPQLPVARGPRSDLDLDAVREPWEITKHFLLDYKARIDLLDRRGTQIHKDVVKYVHSGYRDEPRPDLADELRAGYEGGVRWVDGIVKSTVEQLEQWGMLENTVLVITSDHGEAFGEHGILVHGRQLYDELVHVPLVMKGPAPFDGGRALSGGVGLIDIMPTFLEHIGGAPIPGVHGRSFLPLLVGRDGGRPVFSEEIVNRDNTGEDTEQMVTSVRSAHWKYIITFDRLAGTVIEEAYDLRKDPGERTDLCAGSGRIDGLAFDASFCRAVEQARDRIWGAAKQNERLYTSPYGGGRAQVTSKRPAPCGSGG